jgi:hypothetical protein
MENISEKKKFTAEVSIDGSIFVPIYAQNEEEAIKELEKLTLAELLDIMEDDDLDTDILELWEDE